MKNNDTALHHAAYYGHNETAKVSADQRKSDTAVTRVQVLMDYGADVNIPLTNDGTTALHFAAIRGYVKILKVLSRWPERCSCVPAGAGQSRSRSRIGRSSKLDSASHVGVSRILRDLKGGVEIDSGVAHVMADVHLQILLEHGARVNATTVHHFVPLHMAVLKGHASVVQAHSKIVSSSP